MANNVITPSNSLTTQLSDSDSFKSLLVTEGGYISVTGDYGYYASGGNSDIIVAGYVISRDNFAIYSAVSGSTSPGLARVSVTSTGLIQGFVGVNLQGTDNIVSNAGTIKSSSSAGYGVYFYNGGNAVTNNGTIEAYYSIFANSGDISVQNDGVIISTKFALYGQGAVNLNNGGTVRGSIYVFNELNLHNSGFIFGDIVSSAASASDDLIDTSSGVITGLVNLNDGVDTYIGGTGTDRVIGGLGNDTIDLGAGNDVYRAGNGDGRDVLDGGDGIDRYDASDATQAVTVDLSSNTTAGTVGADDIINFENITGGSAADTLTGDDAANRIDGGMGADTINGGAGNDRLIGGTGTDTITGGAGKDILTGGQITGGLDSDTFVFRTGDSGVTAATRDTISDFTDHGRATGTFNTGADLIDLHLIDASTAASGDQAFSFNATKGAAFSGAAGSLIWQQFTGFALISGDTNGDGKADFTIQLNGTHTLFASDFVL